MRTTGTAKHLPSRMAPKPSPVSDEEPFQLLADNMPNLAWMADEAGWIYWYNQRWYEYTGTTPEEMEGWGWQSVHHPDQLQRVLMEWEAGIKTGQPVELLFPLKSADGTYRQFLTRVIPIKDSKGNITHWFGTNTDIDAQKQAQSELEIAMSSARAEQQRLHDLFMQAPAMIAVTRGPDLVYELANSLYLKVLGKSEDIIGKGVLEAFPEIAGQEIADILFNVYKTGVPYVGSEIGMKLDTNNSGNLVDVYFTFVYQPLLGSDGKVEGVMNHAVDVTEHVNARKRAEVSEARFKFMAESLPQLIFTADPDGKVDYFSAQWAEYTGKTIEAILREGVQGFVHPDDLPGNMETWQSALLTGKALQNEQRLRRADGQYRRHVSHARAMLDEDGKIVRWFGSMTDIEDITRTNAQKEDLEKQRAQLLAINQAKDEFISLASHQLRTPATGVKQFIGMLMEGFAGDLTPEQLQFLTRAYESNERQLKIVNDLLKVASVDAGKVHTHPVKLELANLIDAVLAEQSPNFAARNQTVVFAPANRNCVIRADMDLFRMVLENLIDNAGKYTFPDKKITIRIIESGDIVRIAIRDQGVGIAAADKDKLFQKFGRLDNPLSVRVGGTGLGLYWVKKIIDLHNGKISVESSPGKGSTFTVTLPVRT